MTSNEYTNELEEVLLEMLDYFQTTATGSDNSTFEGGKSILDIEVSDSVEELLGRIEALLDLSPTEEDEGSEEY